MPGLINTSTLQNFLTNKQYITQTYVSCIAFKFHCVNDPKNKAYCTSMVLLSTDDSEIEVYSIPYTYTYIFIQMIHNTHMHNSYVRTDI